MIRVLIIALVLLILIAAAGCKKERDPHEYPVGTRVTFIAGKERPGYVPPLTIVAVSYRSPKEIRYFAKDKNGKAINDLSEFEITRH